MNVNLKASIYAVLGECGRHPFYIETTKGPLNAGSKLFICKYICMYNYVTKCCFILTV